MTNEKQKKAYTLENAPDDSFQALMEGLSDFIDRSEKKPDGQN